MSLDFVLKHEDIKSKGAVLLFHGLTGSPFELKKYGQFLYNSGYDVFAECLPGHGEKWEEIYTVQYQDWLDFAYSRFKALRAEYEKVFVSGLCLGAVLALAVAEKFPREIDGVIALSTTLYLDGWRLPWYKCFMPVALSTNLRFYYSYPECEPHGVKNEKTRKAVKKLLEKGETGMDTFPMTGFYELLKLSAYVRKNLSQVVAPILIIHSQEDDLTSTRSSEIVNSGISSKDKEYIVLYDSYHMVLYDNEKEFVFNKAVEFLDSHLSLKVKEKALSCV